MRRFRLVDPRPGAMVPALVARWAARPELRHIASVLIAFYVGEAVVLLDTYHAPAARGVLCAYILFGAWTLWLLRLRSHEIVAADQPAMALEGVAEVSVAHDGSAHVEATDDWMAWLAITQVGAPGGSVAKDGYRDSDRYVDDDDDEDPSDEH